MRISAIMSVFNEESRIRYTLESLKWCDEIIIVDKSSTDKTVDICKEYGAIINIIPNSDAYDPREMEFISQCTGDWFMLMTASDIIDKTLAMEIKHQIEILPENIKCINVPFKNYILGIEDNRSPWHGSPRAKVFRKGNYRINNDVHGALQIIDNTSYTIPESFGYFSHLTHVSVDMMLDRHTRYWRGEGNMYEEDSLQPAFRDIKESLRTTLCQKKTYRLGWDGIALSMAYISYFMFSYLYKWEHVNKNKAKAVYAELRQYNLDSWNVECDFKKETEPIKNNNSLNRSTRVLCYIIGITLSIYFLFERISNRLHRR